MDAFKYFVEKRGVYYLMQILNAIEIFGSYEDSIYY